MSQIIIEEEKLQHNIDVIKEKIKDMTDDKGNPLKIIAVLKGNAYGMGAKNVAKKLLDNNIDFFAVTEVEEAIKLREQGFTNEILVLNSTCIKKEIEEIINNNLTATVGSIESIKRLNEIAKEKQKIVNCHMKIDTGFCRFGFDANNIISSEEYLNQIKEVILESKNIKIVGTYSHFQESYSNDDSVTRKQFNMFIDIIEKIKAVKINPGLLHICNSSAFFKYKDMYFNAVRIGSAFSGRLQISNSTGLQRVGYLESQICEIKEVKKGDKVGYSGTYRFKKDSKIAVVEAGYADGIGVSGPKDCVRVIDKLRTIKNSLLTLLKNGTRYVEIRGKKYPIVGRIGMKNFIIDIANDDIQIGEKVKIDINLVLSNQETERILKVSKEG